MRVWFGCNAMNVETPVTLRPGVYVLDRTVSMTELGWQAIVRAAYRAPNKKLNRRGKARGEGIDRDIPGKNDLA